MISECRKHTTILFDEQYIKSIGLHLEPSMSPDIQAGGQPSSGLENPFDIIATTDLNQLEHESETPEAIKTLPYWRDEIDILANMYDQLLTHLFWWLLEIFIPMLMIYRLDTDGSWVRRRV